VLLGLLGLGRLCGSVLLAFFALFQEADEIS
jgi:hypothetical protein